MFVRHAARLFALCACSTLAPASPALAEAPGGAPATAPAPAAAATQPGRPPAPDATRLRETMKPFLPAVGHWRGEGWRQMGTGEPQRSVSEETVEMRLDGLVLVIIGFEGDRRPDSSLLGEGRSEGLFRLMACRGELQNPKGRKTRVGFSGVLNLLYLTEQKAEGRR